MKFRAAIIALTAIWAVSVVNATLRAQAAAVATPKSVWEGVYTEEQAKRGAEAYLTNCSECHQPELAGDGFAPALAGAEFMNAWNGLTVGDLFERIRISMPPGKENSISNAIKMDIVTHILHFNKFPAGKTELAAQAEVAKQIKIESTKPGQ